MGKHSPLIALATHAGDTAIRADEHLQTSPHSQAFLEPDEVRVLNALVLPKRVGPLPKLAADHDYANIVQAVANSGLIVGLRDNARRAGLTRLYRACASLAERQRFIGRERWNTAKHAAKRIREATGSPPTALSALAATHLVYPDPASRLRAAVRFLVPASKAAEARLAIAGLRGVEVSAHVLPGGSSRSWDEAVRLRGSALVDEGWQLPTPEDAALLSLGENAHKRGLQRMASLVDLALSTRHRDVKWDVFAQRSALWRLQPTTFAALNALRKHFAFDIPESILKRVEPTPWERLLRNVLG